MVYKIYQITKITKSKIQNYIKFELNDDVEFSDRKQKFIYCSNEYPFKDYRIGDEIEINLTRAKFKNYNDYHQEIVKKTSRSYAGGYYNDYIPQSDINRDPRKILTQGSITLSAYETETVYDFLYSALEWLELYIEKANYYPNWQQKKQLPKTITRPDIPYLDAKETKEHFLTSLSGLKAISTGKPSFLLEKLQTEFFSWLDSSGIGVKSCPTELTQSLVDFHSILIGKAGEFTKRRRKEVDENIARMTSEEKQKNFHDIVAAYQEPLENEDKVFETMKGKTYKDVNNKSKFNGNDGQGKEIFKQIEAKNKEQQSASSSSVLSGNLQTLTNYEIIQDVKNNPQNWRIDEIITEFGNFGREKQESVLIHQNARLDDYNQRTGKLNFEGNPIYRAERFSSEEIKEIKRAKNISQTPTNQPIRWNLIIDIEGNKNDWEIKPIVVSHNYYGGNWYQGQPEPMLIHRTAKIDYNQANGDLIIQPGKMYKINDFNDGERGEIGRIFSNSQIASTTSIDYNQKTSFYQSKLAESKVSQPQKDDNSMGTGKILGILGIISALVITSAVVVKKQLNKKIKK